MKRRLTLGWRPALGIVLLLSLSARFTDAGDAAGRAKKLKDGEWAEWLEVAVLFERRGTTKDLARARLLYEACLRAGDDSAFETAARRLVAIHLNKKGPFPSNHAAARLLTNIARKSGDASVLEEVERLRAKIVPQKRALVEKATKAAEKGLFRIGEENLRKALILPFSLPSEVGERVTDDVLFRRLTEAGEKIEAKFRARFEGKETVCAECKGKSARLCPQCGGKGQIRKPIPPGQDLPGGTYMVKCTHCKGVKMLMCEKCQCTGFDIRLLPKDEARNLVRFAKQTFYLLRDGASLDKTLEKVQKYALGFRIDVPDTFLPEDPDAVYLFPFKERTSIPSRHKSLWRSRAVGSGLARFNLLMDFGVVVARCMRPYRLPLCLTRTVKALRNLPAEVSHTVPLPPGRLSAFPKFYHDRWECVRGTYRGEADIAGYRVLTFMKVSADRPNDMIFVAWNPLGRNGTRLISELSRGYKRLADFSHQYPFKAMAEFKEALAPGQELDLFGRLVYRDKKWPRKIFEVWWAGPAGAGASPEGSPGDPLPATPSPGPLLTRQEDWILKTGKFDRLLREGHLHLRKALGAESKAALGCEDFKRWSETVVTNLQKARACYEKAWSKAEEPALAHLLSLVNRKILGRIEIARTR